MNETQKHTSALSEAVHPMIGQFLRYRRWRAIIAMLKCEPTCWSCANVDDMSCAILFNHNVITSGTVFHFSSLILCLSEHEIRSLVNHSKSLADQWYNGILQIFKPEGYCNVNSESNVSALSASKQATTMQTAQTKHSRTSWKSFSTDPQICLAWLASHCSSYNQILPRSRKVFWPRDTVTV